MNTISRILHAIEGAKRIVITSHIHPDGDSIGSSSALWHLLAAKGKESRIVYPDQIPATYRFLLKDIPFTEYGEGDDEFFSRADLCFILDVSTNDRLGRIYDAARRAGIFRVCIDHHLRNVVDAELKLVNPDACSTSQLIYELYQSYAVRLPRAAAKAIYAGIHTDTVSFNFLGTNARTHEIVATLIREGVSPKQMWLKLYGNDSASFLKLAGSALAKLELSRDGAIAWVKIAGQEWEQYGVQPHEAEALTRFPLTLKGVKVIALFCEEKRGRVRVSLRALDHTNVGVLAEKLGGGGHFTSAGATIAGSLDEVIERVLNALRRYMKLDT